MIRFSLRELLVAVFLTATGIAALRSDGIVVPLFLTCVALLCTGVAIVAFVGINHLRAFAIGFTIPTLIYVGLVALGDHREFNPHTGELPTTKTFRYVYDLVRSAVYTDMTTGKVVPGYDPTTQQATTGGGGFTAGIAMTAERPDRRTFMTVAHAICTMVFGWFGGKFALAVYCIQHQTEKSGEP